MRSHGRALAATAPSLWLYLLGIGSRREKFTNPASQAVETIIWCVRDEPKVTVGKQDRMRDPIIVREWNADDFHRRILEYEKEGYIARLCTYRVTAEMNPETGEVIHLYVIEMFAPDS